MPLVPDHDEMMQVLILTSGAQLQGAPEGGRQAREVQGQGGVREEEGQGDQGERQGGEGDSNPRVKLLMQERKQIWIIFISTDLY